MASCSCRGLHYLAGGNTKVYGASLPRFREGDFGAIEHLEGTSPAWPFDKHPAGLADSSDQVGRNFMMHNNAHLVCIDIVDNLWVIGGGFLPSSAAMNPALTIASRALRAVAESDLGR